MASSNTTNINNNLFSDMSNSDILFINILNTMYNDNLRIIHHLMDQNNEITSQLIDVFNNRRRQNIPLNNSRTYTYQQNNANNNRNRNIPNENSNGNNQRRVYIDNIPYYVDDLQLFTIPSTTTNTRNTRNTTNASANISNQFSRILNSFLEPINIVPTQIQIENATRTIVYGDILEPINNSCPISLETFLDTSRVSMIRHCRHIFNTSSLMSWFNSNCKCPVCRYDIRDYNPNINFNQQEAEQENEVQQIDSTNNQEMNEQTRLHTNSTNPNNNSIETLFVEILTDLSNNNIEYTLDNTSQLFNSLFSANRRRESRR